MTLSGHILILSVVAVCVPVYSTILLNEDFEVGQTVGEQPTGATRVRSSPNTASNYVKVVADAENAAGGGLGQGVQIYDNDGVGSALEYDVVGSGEVGISFFRFSFDFAYVLGAGPDQITLSGGAQGAALTSNSRRWFSTHFEANGSVEGVDVSDGLHHHMDVFVNDSDTDTLSYSGPEGAGLLPTNSVAFFVDGVLVNEDLLLDTVFDSSNNFGRIGFNTYSAATNVSYTFDNLTLVDLDEKMSSDSSWLIYEGTNGLVYAGYANEGQSNAVNTVPDFSNAGYRGGGVSIPFIPSAVIVSNGPGDDSQLIQDAIDAVSELPIGPDGFRGAVLLTAGEYTVAETLNVGTSGVVIRGEGSQDIGGTRITYTATTQSNLFEVDNSGDQPREVSGTRQDIVDPYVPVGAKYFQVADASGYSAGDQIIIQNTMNQQWLDEMSNMGQWGWTPSAYQLKFRRTVTAVEGNVVSIDAPVVQAIETRYGGGVVYKYDFAGELEHIGFEGLRLESTYASETDELHGWNAIKARRLKNGWVRQVTGRYFGYGLVSLISNCRQITVEDCAMLDPKSITTGGRKYSFNIDDSDYILMQRCLTRGGRHDFVSGSQTPGPNVFVDCRANETNSDIGPHHRYSTGQLYDNIMGGEMNVQNREDSGSGHGWAGAQIMFWNCDASSIICDAPTGAMNWCVGSIGTKSEGKSYWAPEEPFGIWDSHNNPVVPRSLYYAQLAERLGTNALNNVLLPEQKTGGIWTQLNSWGGDGLFLDGLVVWREENAFPDLSNQILVRGVVRNLQSLENGFTSLWSKVSGPGSISFTDNTALQTTVSFSLPGSYVLLLTTDDGTIEESAILNVQITTASPEAQYLEWLTLFPTIGSFTNLTDDFEQDGLVNLTEYALGGNPTLNDAAITLPTLNIGSNWLYYVYNRRDDGAARGLGYSVWSGTDLVNGSMTNIVAPFGISTEVDGFESVTNRISTDTERAQFMRLKVDFN